VTPGDRYKTQNPTPPVNHEYEYLQAKSTGYGGGTMIGNIGAGHHARNGAGRSTGFKKITLGNVLAFLVMMGASVFAFTITDENADELWKAVVGSVVTLYVLGKLYAIGSVKKRPSTRWRVLV